MTDWQFADLVQRMRDAQKRYFRTRSVDALEESKHLEGQVDRALERHRDQPNLFDRAEEEK